MADYKAIKPYNTTARTNLNMFLCYVFIAITIVSSDILIVKLSLNLMYKTIAQYAYIVMVSITVIICYVRNRLRLVLTFNSGFFIYTILMLLLAAIITEDNINAYIFKCFLIIGGYFGVKAFCFENFYYAFRRIMKVLMLISLLLYAMNLTKIGYAALPTQTISTGVSYTTIGLANMFNSAFYQIPRAQSVFWEAGVYAAYLNILLLLELMCRKKTDMKYLLLILVSILTTVSTTGYLVMLIILAAYILSKPVINIRTKLVIIVLLMILFIVIVTNETLMAQLTSKITDNSESFKDRWLSVDGNFLIIKKSPLFGLGPIKSQTEIESYISSQGGRKSLSNLNTILANYSLFGFLPFVFYLYHLLKFSFSCMASVIGRVLVLLSLVFLLSSTGYQFSPFFMLIFMYRMGESPKNDTINQVVYY